MGGLSVARHLAIRDPGDRVAAPPSRAGDPRTAWAGGTWGPEDWCPCPVSLTVPKVSPAQLAGGWMRSVTRSEGPVWRWVQGGAWGVELCAARLEAVPGPVPCCPVAAAAGSCFRTAALAAFTSHVGESQANIYPPKYLNNARVLSIWGVLY